MKLSLDGMSVYRTLPNGAIESFVLTSPVYVEWLADGNEPEPADPLPTPAATISALQGLLAIDNAGLSSAYEAWANDQARTFAQRAFINKAQTWRRDDPTLADAAAAFGLTDAQIDELFALAATL